jgi:hypothetical protein
MLLGCFSSANLEIESLIQRGNECNPLDRIRQRSHGRLLEASGNCPDLEGAEQQRLVSFARDEIKVVENT